MIERRRLPVLALLAALLLPGSAGAHNVLSPTVRELVRIQGYRAPAPRGVEVASESTLAILGDSVHFAIVEWQVFALAEADPQPTPAPPQLSIQGERALLRRIVTAHADQRVTILAERRPGGGDLFVLNVDLCPEK
ncbi:MAG: hypothetical protein ABI629_20685 [bacterium]